MIGPNDIKNTIEIEEFNTTTQKENKKRYKLHFNEDTIGKIRVFCESFHVELNKFIVNTIGYFLYDIEYDIGSKEFDLIGGYFDISKLVGVQSNNNTREANEKFNEIEAEFPLLISEAIDYVCDAIPLTPEEFIEDTINWEIVDIMDHIKEDRYDFLDKYKDFSKITQSIKSIKKPTIENNKEIRNYGRK